MKPLLRAMLLSPAFRDPANRGALIKSPVELIVGTVHVLGLPVPEKTQLVRMMQGLGQVPFDPPNVKGWAGRRELDHDLHAAAAPAVPAPHRRGHDRVASMDGGMMIDAGPNRRAERRQQVPADDSTMQMMEPRARSRAAACAMPAARRGSARRLPASTPRR